jgi:hypothetical protein
VVSPARPANRAFVSSFFFPSLHDFSYLVRSSYVSLDNLFRALFYPMGFFKKAGSRKRSADALSATDDRSSSAPVHSEASSAPVHREEQQRCYYLQRVAKKLGVVQFLAKHLPEEEVMDLAHEQARQQAMGPPSQRPGYRDPAFRRNGPNTKKAKAANAWRVAVDRHAAQLMKASSESDRRALAADTALIAICTRAVVLEASDAAVLRHARAAHAQLINEGLAVVGQSFEDSQVVVLAALAQHCQLGPEPDPRLSHPALPVLQRILVHKHATQVEQNAIVRDHNNHHPESPVAFNALKTLFRDVKAQGLPSRAATGIPGLIGCSVDLTEAKLSLLQHPVHSLTVDLSHSKYLVWVCHIDGFVERLHKQGTSDILCSFKCLSGLVDFQQDRNMLLDCWFGRAKPLESQASPSHLSGDTARHILTCLAKHKPSEAFRFTLPEYFPAKQQPKATAAVLSSARAAASSGGKCYPHGDKAMLDIGYLGAFTGEGELRRPVVPANGMAMCLPEYMYLCCDLAEIVELLHWCPVGTHHGGGIGMYLKMHFLDHANPRAHRQRLPDASLLKSLWTMDALAKEGLFSFSSVLFCFVILIGKKLGKKNRDKKRIRESIRWHPAPEHTSLSGRPWNLIHILFGQGRNTMPGYRSWKRSVLSSSGATTSPRSNCLTSVAGALARAAALHLLPS